MKADVSYLLGKAVETATMKNDDLEIEFEGDGRLTIYGSTDDGSHLPGTSFVNATHDENDEYTLIFGRAYPGHDLVDEQILTTSDFKVDLPGWDQEERDLTIPPHPDERVQPEPTTPE